MILVISGNPHPNCACPHNLKGAEVRVNAHRHADPSLHIGSAGSNVAKRRVPGIDDLQSSSSTVLARTTVASGKA
jgi:hypothetical protein